jgi:RNA polymerase sigma-70 factor (ECF subfamily)
MLSRLPSNNARLRVVPAAETGTLPAFEQIYRSFSPYVAALVARLDPRAPDPEDVVQDVFLEAARGLRRLRDPLAVKAWLRTVCVRLLGRRLRRRRMWRFLGIDGAADELLLVDAGTSAPDRLLLEGVYRVLDRLPVPDRLAFVLHHIEGETLETVAGLCRCSLATAKRRIARTQQAIEARLGSDGEGRARP